MNNGLATSSVQTVGVGHPHLVLDANLIVTLAALHAVGLGNGVSFGAIAQVVILLRQRIDGATKDASATKVTSR